MPNITAIIPARLASTRLPNKVLADIHGKPMLVRVAEKAQKAGIPRVIIATDHDEVVKIAHQHGLQALITEDCATGTDRVAFAAKALAIADDEFVINVQGDEPLIDPSIIRACAQAIVTCPQPCATPISTIHDNADLMNPNVVKCLINQRSEAMIFSRAPIPWIRGVFPDISRLPSEYTAYRHYGVYAFSAKFLKTFSQLPTSDLERWESLEQLRILQAGFSILALVVDTQPKPAVDTWEDLEKVRALWLNRENH